MLLKRSLDVRKLGALGGDLPSASVLTAAELGGPFGRERIVHAAIGGGTLSDRLRVDLVRLAGFRVNATMDCGFDSEDPLVIGEQCRLCGMDRRSWKCHSDPQAQNLPTVVMGRDPSLSLRMTVGKNR